LLSETIKVSNNQKRILNKKNEVCSRPLHNGTRTATTTTIATKFMFFSNFSTKCTFKHRRFEVSESYPTLYFMNEIIFFDGYLTPLFLKTRAMKFDTKYISGPETEFVNDSIVSRKKLIFVKLNSVHNYAS
jgi:hypothetical protein